MKRAASFFAALLAAGSCGLAAAAGADGAGMPAAATDAAPATLAAQDSGVTVRLRGVSAVSADIAWASGREGTVLRTVDGGAHWQPMHVPGAEKLDFRDVEGFDADTAVVLSIGPGADSRIYRTDDGGRSWTLALQNADPRAFFDCMAFDGERGWMLGDPVEGAFQVYATADGGRTWALQPGAMPPAEKDEAAFAASGTCMATTPWSRRMAVGGGGASRAFLDAGNSATATAWKAYTTSMPARVPAAGIFSAAPAGGDMLLVGGDFEHEAAPGSAALAQLQEDGSLKVSALPDPRGYRSGVACAGDARPRCIAVGPSGVDALVDGRWQPLSETGYDAVDLAADGSGSGWASGDKGRIARVIVRPAP
jgi:photosystem II stability/assembly factor-like uncharacterized protein